MKQKGFLIRDLEADVYRENFFISALFSMLAIRFFLYLTGFPTIGGEGFHIAHMLWGGVLMMISIVILFSFLNKTAVNLAAIIGGIGFGTFIDELGKFITKDNNYFYEPTIAIIYVIFVLIYLIFKAIPKYRTVSDKEYLVNAIEMTKEAVINDLDIDEEKRAMEYLEKSDKHDPIVKSLQKLLDDIKAAPVPRPGILASIRHLFREIYRKLAKSNIIAAVIVAGLLFQSAIIIIFTFHSYLLHQTLSFDEWGRIFSSILSIVFIIIGILILPGSKYAGFRFFKFSVLVSIFLTQFFFFYSTQFYALSGLILNIFILAVIEYVLVQEQTKEGIGVI